MRFSLVVHVTGLIVRVFGVLFIAPLGVALVDADYADAIGFAMMAVTTTTIGHAMRLAGGRATEDAVERLRRDEGLAIVSVSWLVIAWFASVPFLWNGLGPIDAFFEAMSGLTSTGATVLRDFDRYSRAIFLWRALTTWVGGMGMIALFIAILPRLA